MSLAVLILTYNEATHIRDCIASVADLADEIVVIDAGSADETVRLAQEAGARVVHHPMTEGFAAQRNFALAQTAAQWVFYLDADERVTPELAAELRRVMRGDTRTAWAVPRKFMMYGRWIKHGGLYPDYTPRLFSRDVGLKWQGTIHESAQVAGEMKRLVQPLCHFGFRGWEPHLAKDNRYTTMLAQQAWEKGKRASVASLVLHPLWAFIRMYFLRAGWRDGVLGLSLALLRFSYTLQKYVKLRFYGDDPLKGARKEHG